MSKLKIAFTGAAQNILKRRNLITDGIVVGGVTTAAVAVGAVAGAAVIPVIVQGAVVCAAIDGAVGAYKALKHG